MNKLISVVVPIYNVEKYLRQCLDSIKSQTYENLEVLLVDDGSTDGSGKICDEYAASDQRFRVFHQQNSGAFAARRVGVQNAKGAYIAFVDGDDWIVPEAYCEMYQMVENASAEIVICNVSIDNELLKKSWIPKPPVQEGYYCDYKSRDILEYFFFQREYLEDGLSLLVTSKLIRRELVTENYRRVDARLHYFEDVALVLFCLMCAQGIVVCNIPFYHYRQRENSLCHSVDVSYLEQVNIFYNNVCDTVNEQSEELGERLRIYIADRTIYGINHMMGLKLKREVPYFMPPFARINPEEKIALYGAGEIGKAYYNMLMMTRPGQVALWVDRKYEILQKEGLPVEGLDALRLKRNAFDRILIAVKYQDSAEAIKRDLLSMGMDPKTILWERPGTIFSV